MAEQELPTLEAVETLDGSHFQIKLGGTMALNSAVGSLLNTEDISETQPPQLRFLKRNGVIIPRDSTTFYALSTFHAFEKILESLKKTTSLEISDYLKSTNGKFKIRFEPSFRLAIPEGTATITYKFNAAFDPLSNQFVLFKRSEVETVPFSNNIKVLAHELGHGLFKKAFFLDNYTLCSKPTAEEEQERKKDKFFPGRFESEFVISGINEGYSDFFSYMVTSAELTSDDFGGVVGNSRSLTGQPFTFADLINDKVCSNSFYCIGTLFARALYKTSELYHNTPDLKMEFSRRVFDALQKTQMKMREQPFSEQVPAPHIEVVKCGLGRNISLNYNASLVNAFLSAFVSSFPEQQEKKSLCENLKNLFNTTAIVAGEGLVCEP